LGFDTVFQFALELRLWGEFFENCHQNGLQNGGGGDKLVE
jgi:hypothetical protein